MGLNFSTGDVVAFDQDGFENTEQIILKTDSNGFVREASPAIAELGFPRVEILIGPHVLDLADDPFRAGIDAAFVWALAARGPSEWVEFRSRTSGANGPWFAIRFTALMDDRGHITGTLGIVRNVAKAKQLEERLFRAELTDPLTGLTNRQAWLHMLDHLVGNEAPSCLALVDIDFFKAINLHYGLATGDRFLIDFAEYLRTLTPAGVSISRVGASRFGLLFSGWTVDQANLSCREIVDVLHGLGCSDRQGRFAITASIGLTTIGADIDETVKAAERALRLARAKGGNTVSGI